MSLHQTTTLPEWAETTYRARGAKGLHELVEAGLLDAGDYTCPACLGSGEGRRLGGLPFQCEACAGWGCFGVSRAGYVRGRLMSAAGEGEA